MPDRDRAADLFADYLTRRGEGGADDIDQVCAEHADLADELRALHLEWRKLRHVRDRLRSRGFLSERLSEGAREAGEKSGLRTPSSVDLLRFGLRSGASHDRYKVRDEVASGGQGSIYRVWDEELQRDLAMKVIHDRPRDAPSATRAVARFLEEARVTGQLDHPGVVPVHELGVDDKGAVFFTMKLVRGRDLNDILDLVRDGAEGWTRTRALGVMLKVCEAMGYAHSKGVIHRDLKPANVMVGRFGEVYVMDWGLARVLDQPDQLDLRPRETALHTAEVRSLRKDETASRELLTMDGHVMGTPAYMPPEQAAGESERMGPRSDVYSCGAMLYQILTGRAPYNTPGEALGAVLCLHAVLEGPPKPVHVFAPDVPVELEAICDKAMARDPKDRYADTLELALDLRAYLEHRVVSAYESGAFAELRKWIARNRGLAAACAAAILALVLGLAVSMHLKGRAERERSNVLRLSAFRTLEELENRATRLWPALPAKIPDYRKWLADASALVATLGEEKVGLYAQLAALRAAGTPRDAESVDRAIREHPRYAELVDLRGELGALRAAAAVRAGEALDLDLALPLERADLPAAVLQAMAWPMVAPDRVTFGRELEGLALAKRAHDTASADRVTAEIADTLAWAYFAVGLDDQAFEVGREALDLAAEEGKTAAFEVKLARLEEAIREQQGESGRAAIERLSRRVDVLESEIADPHRWQFADDETAWWHGQLTKLVRDVEALADEETGLVRGRSERWGLGVERRLASAELIRDVTMESDRARRLWAAATAAIAEHPAYGGLRLAPQEGLLPLGPDPASGLWEFAHVLSGSVPERDADGNLDVDDSHGLVLVLVPGGTFSMGAQATDAGAPHYDPAAEEDEGPVREIELAPFFLAKYEMTQGQWERFAGSNPSRYAASKTRGGRAIGWRNPVENISWDQCKRTLERLDLTLPTEAQWEYAARAGTGSRWFTGDGRDSLVGYANLADQAARRAGDLWPQIADWPELDDGHATHAPVGSFGSNPFGLYDVVGNVKEWCLDGYVGSYSFPVRPETGERIALFPRQRVARGGSHADRALDARSSYRVMFSPDFRYFYLGVRPSRPVRP